MAEEEVTDQAAETQQDDAQQEDDQRVPYERFQKANTKAKEAADRATKLEKDLKALQAQMEERESAGLPELERQTKRAEALERKVQEAEERASEATSRLERQERERWVSAAASKLDFIDADDASRFVDLEGVESREEAERAVKRVAKAKPHLVRAEEAPLPGKVLNGGRKADDDPAPAGDDKAALGAELLRGLGIGR